MIAAPTGPRRLRPADLQQLEAAQSALRTGRVDDALSRLHSLQVRNPSHVTVLANLAMAQRRAGDAAAALATFALALPQPDAPAELWFNHANLLRDLGRSGDAERAYRKAVVLRPTLHQANTNLANLLSSQKQPAQAESLHRTAVTAQPAVTSADI